MPQGCRPQAGEFAFATSDRSEGDILHHCLGMERTGSPDHLHHQGAGRPYQPLHEKLQVGQEVRIEGPYGCFDFDNGQPRQIWIGGGIGITPFIAALKHLALERQANPEMPAPAVDLFQTTADYDETALAKLTTDGKAANVRLHVLVDARDGRLTGERIRRQCRDGARPPSGSAAQPVSAKRCGRILPRMDYPWRKQFHQELFAMR